MHAIPTKSLFAFLLLLAGFCSANAALLDGRTLTVRWLSFGSPIAQTNFSVSADNTIEVAEFPPGGGPVSIDVQETEERITVTIRWINTHAVTIMNWLEFTGFPPFTHLAIEDVYWIGIDKYAVYQANEAWFFYVGAYPGLNSPDFFAKLALHRTHLKLTHVSASQGAELVVSGKVGENYTLQSTTNLASGVWASLSSFSLTTATTNIMDSTATNFGSRYYRLASP